MIKKKALSITVPERLVEEADRVAREWGQSRAFVVTRWLLEGCGVGMTGDEVEEYFPKGLAVAGVPSSGSGGPVPDFGITPIVIRPEMNFPIVGFTGEAQEARMDEPPLADSDFDGLRSKAPAFVNLDVLRGGEAGGDGVGESGEEEF